jgi:hypothetical protein
MTTDQQVDKFYFCRSLSELQGKKFSFSKEQCKSIPTGNVPKFEYY